MPRDESRRCGACQLCCTLVPVPALNKPGGVACRHLCAAGCSIHRQPEQPRECDVYHCLWLDGYGKRADRPDRVGVVLGIHEAKGQRFLAALLAGHAKRKHARRLIDRVRKQFPTLPTRIVGVTERKGSTHELPADAAAR